MKAFRITLRLLVLISFAGFIAFKLRTKPHDCSNVRASLKPAETILSSYSTEQYQETLTTKKSWEYASKIEAETIELKKIRLWGDRTVKLYYSAIMTELSAFPSKARAIPIDKNISVPNTTQFYVYRLNRYCDFY